MAGNWQWENTAAGAAAGFATVTFSHPLDVVRTRFQVNDGRLSNLPTYKNTPHTFFTIARSEGLRWLYGGFYPAVLGSTISWALYFYSINKVGKDEGTLTRVVATRAEIDLKIINDEYHRRNSVPPDKAVAKEGQSNYFKGLMLILCYLIDPVSSGVFLIKRTKSSVT